MTADPVIQRLAENQGIAYAGRHCDPRLLISAALARRWLAERNPSGRPNGDVLRPTAGATDLVRIPRGLWTIDFPPYLDEREAALYVRPFARLRRSRAGHRWGPGRAPTAMRVALVKGERYLATPTAGRHRVYAWLPPEVVPDRTLVVFARDDDWFFGVLQSRFHQLWVRQTGAGGRYASGESFETFPFPWPPTTPLAKLTRGQETQRAAVAQAARALDRQRATWLADGADPRRTLAALDQARPDWLEALQAGLDEAVASAYGWADLPEDEVAVPRLLELNRGRAPAQSSPNAG